MVWVVNDNSFPLMPWNLRFQPVEKQDVESDMRKFDPTQPRDESGKWTSTGGGLASSVWSRVLAKPESERGISINYVGQEPTDGFMVAFQGAWNPVSEADFSDPVKGKKVIADYLRKHVQALAASEKTYLGVWFNTETRTYEFDLSEKISSRSRAIEVGRQREQESAWDVVNSDVVFIGARDMDRQT